jgi:hypothetical protein
MDLWSLSMTRPGCCDDPVGRREAERVQRQLLGSSGSAGGPALPASASGAAEPNTLVPVKEHALLHPEHTVTVTAPASVPTPEGPPVTEVPVVAPSAPGYHQACAVPTTKAFGDERRSSL